MEDSMKRLTIAAFGAVLLTVIASPSQAQNTVVWETIKGIAQANDVVGGSGTPWSAREGGGV
jgi:hypothetical protein